MKRIGVIGTRRRDTFLDYKAVQEAFYEIYHDGDWLVSGGCPKGGDSFAAKMALKYGMPILTFYPDWRKYSKSAGFIRNTFIAEHSDILIACVSEDRTGGTEDTIKKFLKDHDEKELILV